LWGAAPPAPVNREIRTSFVDPQYPRKRGHCGGELDSIDRNQVSIAAVKMLKNGAWRFL